MPDWFKLNYKNMLPLLYTEALQKIDLQHDFFFFFFFKKEAYCTKKKKGKVKLEKNEQGYDIR